MIEKFCAEHGVGYTPEIAEKLHHYADYLMDYNQKINLTAIKTPEDIKVKHFIDSITVLCATDVKGSVLDIGSGAGFPGIILKLFKPEIKLTLMDSNGKKAKFLELLCKELDIESEVLLGRAEEFGSASAYRGKFDLVCARAVAELNVLCEYCIPFVKPNGVFAAMKGSNWREELNGARMAIQTLGGKVTETKEFMLPDTSQRGIILIEKISHTPTGFPRIGAKISKYPL